MFWKDAVYTEQDRLDPKAWRWIADTVPAGALPIDPVAALTRLGSTSPLLHLPIGVIGPREATASQYALAMQVGAEIAKMHLPLICGGKTGVMEAAAKGSAEQGGLTIGLLPGHDWRDANPYIRLPIATGLSEARNMVIAKSCQVLIAIGGSYGTLTEIAYGLHFSKTVITLSNAHSVEGSVTARTAAEAVEHTATALFAAAAAP